MLPNIHRPRELKKAYSFFPAFDRREKRADIYEARGLASKTPTSQVLICAHAQNPRELKNMNGFIFFPVAKRIADVYEAIGLARAFF